MSPSRPAVAQQHQVRRRSSQQQRGEQMEHQELAAERTLQEHQEDLGSLGWLRDALENADQRGHSLLVLGRRLRTWVVSQQGSEEEAEESSESEEHRDHREEVHTETLWNIRQAGTAAGLRVWHSLPSYADAEAFSGSLINNFSRHLGTTASSSSPADSSHASSGSGSSGSIAACGDLALCSASLSDVFSNQFDALQERFLQLPLAKAFENKPLISCGPMLVVGVIMGTLNFSCVWILFPATHTSTLSVTSIVFRSSFALAACAYHNAVITDPGSIPDEWRGEPEDGRPVCVLARHPGYEPAERKSSNGAWRYCKKENKFKPDRAHYCRNSGRNVLRMDHYCPWVCNTIGFRNHKYFFLFLLYTVLASDLASVKLVLALVRGSFPAAATFMMWQGTFLSGIFSGTLTPFLVLHGWLLSNNLTTIEYCERMQNRSGNDRSRYDLGFVANVQSVLGEHYHEWLLPFIGPSGDGVFFETPAFTNGQLQPKQAAEEEGEQRQRQEPRRRDCRHQAPGLVTTADQLLEKLKQRLGWVAIEAASSSTAAPSPPSVVPHPKLGGDADISSDSTGAAGHESEDAAKEAPLAGGSEPSSRQLVGAGQAAAMWQVAQQWWPQVAASPIVASSARVVRGAGAGLSELSADIAARARALSEGLPEEPKRAVIRTTVAEARARALPRMESTVLNAKVL